MKLLVALLIAAVALASAACGYDPESYFIVDGKAHAVKTSPLVDYVLTYDSNYNWFDTNERMSGKGWTGYLLNLTSQAWMADITSRPVWSHNLLVIRPDEINEETNIGSIYVTGENNSDEPRPPKELSADIVVASMLALKTKSTVAILYNIPNQAMAFRDPTTGDFGKTMQEDNLVAYTWNEYVRNTTRAEQVIYIPMTKAVFAAMDAVTDFTTYSPKLFPRGLSKFVIAGASKRGATTWLTAVVDAAQPAGRRRVEGIVPIVFDAVNFTEVIGHMFQNLNGWSFAFEPYRRAGVTELIANPKGMETLSCVIDPIKYDSWNNITRALVVSGTGDEFFQPSDDWFWWDSFVAETQTFASEHYRLHVGNAEHAMVTGLGALMDSVGGFVTAIQAKHALPTLAWHIADSDGTLAFETATKPSKVKLWYAVSNPSKPLGRRDFRMIKGDTEAGPCVAPAVKVADVCINPVVWKSKDVQVDEVRAGIWGASHTSKTPAKGQYVGFFFEIKYDAQPVDYHFTTQVSLVPRAFPYGPCTSTEQCHGELV